MVFGYGVYFIVKGGMVAKRSHGVLKGNRPSV